MVIQYYRSCISLANDSITQFLGQIPHVAEEFREAVAIMIMLLRVWLREVKDYIYQCVTKSIEAMRSGDRSIGVGAALERERVADSCETYLAEWYTSDNPLTASGAQGEVLKGILKATNGGEILKTPDELTLTKFCANIVQRAEGRLRGSDYLPGVPNGAFMRAFDATWDTRLRHIYEARRVTHNNTTSHFIIHIVHEAIIFHKISYVPWSPTGKKIEPGHWRLLTTSEVGPIKRLVRNDIPRHAHMDAALDQQVLTSGVSDWSINGGIMSAFTFRNKTSLPLELSWSNFNAHPPHIMIDGHPGGVEKASNKFLSYSCLRYLLENFDITQPVDKYIMVCAHLYASSGPFLLEGEKPVTISPNHAVRQREFSKLGWIQPPLNGISDHKDIFHKFVLYAYNVMHRGSPYYTLSGTTKYLQANKKEFTTNCSKSTA